MSTEHKPHSELVETIRRELDLIVTAEGHTRALDDLSAARIETALRGLVEQLSVAERCVEDARIARDEEYQRAERLLEQLEAAQKVVDAARAAWKNDQDFPKLVAALREYDSNPASSPVTNDPAGDSS